MINMNKTSLNRFTRFRDEFWGFKAFDNRALKELSFDTKLIIE